MNGLLPLVAVSAFLFGSDVHAQTLGNTDIATSPALIAVAEQRSKTDKETHTSKVECLVSGKSWAECFPKRSTDSLPDPYHGVLSNFGEVGAGLGTLSAPQSVKKSLTNGIQGRAYAPK